MGPGQPEGPGEAPLCSGSVPGSFHHKSGRGTFPALQTMQEKPKTQTKHKPKSLHAAIRPSCLEAIICSAGDKIKFIIRA